MLNSSLPERLFCPIRREWVIALPEERIRQYLIQQMVNQWGYPINGIAIEKDLSQMPHLEHLTHSLPQRRADVVVFAKNIHPRFDFYPLLLIECKAINLTEKVIRQVIGYNFYVKSCFIAIVNHHEIRLGWYDPFKKDFSFIPFIPPFSELVQEGKKFNQPLS